MKIKLEFPFKDKWKSGYIVINPEGRRNACLVNSKTDRTTISYARYLVSVNLKRFLTNAEKMKLLNDSFICVGVEY